MKLFKRYILYEILITCSIAVMVFVGILLVANVFRDVIELLAAKKISLLETIELVRILLPSAISYALPLGMLTGILIVIGRMSANNEILFLKSIGVGLRAISGPILSIAAICTLIAAYINMFYAPTSVSKYRKFFRHIVETHPMRFIVPGTFNDSFPGYVIYVGEINAGTFSNMCVWQLDERDRLDVFLFSKTGEITFDQSNNSFKLRMTDGNAEKFDHTEYGENEKRPPNIIFFENIDIQLGVGELIRSRSGGEKKLAHMSLPDLLAAKKDLSNHTHALSEQQIKHKITAINLQISKRIADAFGILVMSLLAVPLGMKNNRADKSINTVIAFVLCLGYYFVTMLLSWMGANICFRPDVIIWIPNIVIACIGGIGFFHAKKH